MTRNWDGFQLVSNPRHSAHLSHVADPAQRQRGKPGTPTYFMTPLIVRSRNWVQVHDDLRGTLPFWSGWLLRTRHGVHSSKSSWRRLRCLVAKSSFDSQRRCRRMCSIRNPVATALYSAAKIMEQGNFYDGADKFKALFAAEVDPANAEWVRDVRAGQPAHQQSCDRRSDWPGFSLKVRHGKRSHSPL